MQAYPQYSLRDALSEYATAFFSLLEEAYRLQFANYRMLANISLAPNMEDSDRIHFLESLDMASQDPRDILNQEEDDGTGIETLRDWLS